MNRDYPVGGIQSIPFLAFHRGEWLECSGGIQAIEPLKISHIARRLFAQTSSSVVVEAEVPKPNEVATWALAGPVNEEHWQVESPNGNTVSLGFEHVSALDWAWNQCYGSSTEDTAPANLSEALADLQRFGLLKFETDLGTASDPASCNTVRLDPTPQGLAPDSELEQANSPTASQRLFKRLLGWTRRRSGS